MEFPGDFSEINHSTLAQKDLLGASQSFTSIGSLSVWTALKLEDKAGLLFSHLRSCSVNLGDTEPILCSVGTLDGT